MDFYYIMRSRLFEGLTKKQVTALLPCLDAQVATFEKNQVIYSAGQSIRRMGLILEGDVRIEQVSAFGDMEILTIMEQGKTFGEAAACTPELDLLVDYVAERDCRVLFLDVEKIIHPCQKGCPSHGTVTTNLVRLLAQRNMELARRAFVMTNRTIRSKVLAYLSTAATAYGSLEFDIPYNRQELASYLGVDRSALSAELSRMQKEGLIAFRKNHFELTGQLS